MTDNLFDRLADLMRSSGPVNWRLAREIAESVAGPAEPIDPWLDEELRDLAATAARLVDQHSVLDPALVTAPATVTDRRGWAAANIEALGYLAEPLAEKLSSDASSPLQPLGPALLGMQMGATIGTSAQSVLAGFDLGLPSGSATGPVFVVPNIEAFAGEEALDPRQARLWIALHEVTHHAAYAVPWLREHVFNLAHAFVEGLEFDVGGIERRIEALQDPEALQQMMHEPTGVAGLLSPEDEGVAAGRLRGVLAVVEGYADRIVERAAGDLIPAADELRSAIDRRRLDPSAGEQLLEQALAFDLKHADHRVGERFCAEVARRWGDEALDRIWEGPEMLPDEPELHDVVGWAARVLL
ncbi:MAG TPA: zinc-dependent metalloprotease [Acidimicrobiia bacterium]|nr:zinc-dependent metalloprotease [Acidimicrobiia bacterium]